MKSPEELRLLNLQEKKIFQNQPFQKLFKEFIEILSQISQFKDNIIQSEEEDTKKN